MAHGKRFALSDILGGYAMDWPILLVGALVIGAYFFYSR